MLNNQTIHIWKTSIKKNFKLLFNQYKNILTEEELDKAELFHQEKDRASYLTRRIMCRLLLSKYLDCLPEQIGFKEGFNKKPEVITPTTSFCFNISHSSDYIIIAITNALPVGIDIERLNPSFLFKDIVNDYFTKEEQAYIFVDKDKALEAFFYLWTRKEAYLKYTSEGLLGDLKNLPNLVDPEKNTLFKVHSFLIHPGYCCSLVYPKPMMKLKFYEFDARLEETSFVPHLLKPKLYYFKKDTVL